MELARRNTFRNTITRVRDFCNDVVIFEAHSIAALKERMETLKAAFEKLTDEHLNLVEAAADQAAVDVHNDFYADIETIYLETVVKIRDRIVHLENLARQANVIPVNNNANNNNVQNQPVVAAATEIKLERLKLHQFDGNFAKWKEWISMYNSLVHNKNYDDTEKFHYMRSALSGFAESTISGWNVTGENYKAAYDSLVELYDNPYRIILALLDELFELEKPKVANYENLRLLINTINRSTLQLKVAGCPVEHWDNLLVHFLLKRMPNDTRSKWETSRDLKEMPKLAEVLAFIQRQASGSANSNQHSNDFYQQQQPQKNFGAIPKQPKQNGNGHFQTKQSLDSSGIFCYLCKNPHPTYRCAKLNSMGLKEIRSRVSELKLCFVCLSPGHRAGSNACKLGNCPICGGRHNRILCDKSKAINTVSIQHVPDVQQSQSQLPMTAPVNQAIAPVQYQGVINQMQSNPNF